MSFISKMGIRTWLRLALFNFLLATLLGALLRYVFVQEIPGLKFRFVLHAHSHVAMLGWLYLALFALLIAFFLPAEKQAKPVYKWLVIGTEISVLGMLATFPFMGYAGLSIAFSTLHLILSYIFAWYFLRDLRRVKGEGRPMTHSFVRAAIWFMIISTLGLWGIAPIVIFGLKGSAFYYAAVQFFLHFQFNGWYLFTVLGLLVYWLEQRGIWLPGKVVRKVFYILIPATVLTYALAIAWSTPHWAVFLLNSLGVLLQLIAAGILFRLLFPRRRAILQGLSGWSKWFLGLAFAGYFLKVLIQTAVIIPYIATIGFTIRNYVIGFIHLILLLVISAFIFGLGINKGVFSIQRPVARLGMISLSAGFLLSEFLLFLQGTFFWAALGFLPGYYTSLFVVSALIPLGVGLFLTGQRGNRWKKSG